MSLHSSEQSTETGVLLATAGYDHTIRLWQAHTGKSQRSIPHPDSHVNALQFSPDRQKLAAASYQAVRIYALDGSSTAPLLRYEGFQKNVTCVGFSEDGKWMYTGGEDKKARIWDLRMSTTSEIQCSKVYPIGQPINCICLHPNQAELILGDQQGVIHSWDLCKDKIRQITVGKDCYKLCNVHQRAIRSVSINSDANYLACVTSSGACHVWSFKDTDGPRENYEAEIAAHNNYGLKCLFSPDSSILATTSADGTIKLWNTVNFNLKRELTTKGQRWVWDCAFTRDAQYLVTASSDGVARLWDVEKGELRKECIGHDKAIVCLAFNDNI